MSSSSKTIQVRTSSVTGNILAVILSIAINKSILWGILHFFCGWWYVIYWLFMYSNISKFINTFVVA